MRPFSNGGLPSVAVLVNRHTRQQKLLKKKFHLFCLLCRLCHFSLTRCQHLFFFASFPRDRGSNPSVSSDAAEAIARSEFGLGFTFSRCLAQRSSPAQRPRGSAHSQRAAGGLRISQYQPAADRFSFNLEVDASCRVRAGSGSYPQDALPAREERQLKLTSIDRSISMSIRNL